MKKRILFAVSILLSAGALPAAAQDRLALPSPRSRSSTSVEQALSSRRTVRQFAAEALTLEELSRLLRAAGSHGVDGVTGATRTYPSAGGIYPLSIYAVAGRVTGITPGIYEYLWKEHALKPVLAGEYRDALAQAALRQMFVARAPLIIVIAARVRWTAAKYGRRGSERYVPMDAGHASQSLHLQAVALGLASATVGAFSDSAVKKILCLEDEEPLLVIPVGRPLGE